MTDQFFQFNESQESHEDDGEDYTEVEDDYDALNDETFGPDATCGDWEEEHNNFVQVKNKKDYLDFEYEDSVENNLVNHITNIDLKNQDHGHRSSLSSLSNKSPAALPKAGLTDISAEKKFDKVISPRVQNRQKTVMPDLSLHLQPPQLPLHKLKTVEELERDIIRNCNPSSNMKADTNNVQSAQFNYKSGQNFLVQTNNYPPGLGPNLHGGIYKNQPCDINVMAENHDILKFNMQQALLQHNLLPGARQAIFPMGNLPIQFAQTRPVMIPQENKFKMKPRQNFRQGSHDQRNGGVNLPPQKTRFYAASNQQRNRSEADTDPFKELMTSRERQWLLNIQLLQLTTPQPEVDDYYYAHWVKKQEAEKEEEKREVVQFCDNSKVGHYREQSDNQSNKERRDSEKDLSSTSSPRVYVPLQFENSLGKLQCGSVTAPRKIIDTDVVSDAQTESPSLHTRDSKKFKYILLEIEQCYVYLLELDDISGVKNDTNSTKLGQDAENNVVVEPKVTKDDCIQKIMATFQNNDKFLNIMSIRKGKLLLLRMFPFLNNHNGRMLQFPIWTKVLQFFPLLSRKDQNDNVLSSYYHPFMVWLSETNLEDVTTLSSLLMSCSTTSSGVKGSSRTPSPSPNKNLLPYVMSNRFGISMVCGILERLQFFYETQDTLIKSNVSTCISNLIVNISSLPNIDNFATPIGSAQLNKISEILNGKNGLQHTLAKKIIAILENS